MSSPASPLLQEQSVANPFGERQIDLPEEQLQRSGNTRKKISIISLIFNLTILITLIYSAGVCINTIQDTLMPKNQYCLHSVSTSYNYLTFAGMGYGSFYGPKCQNHLRITSTYASGKLFCTDTEVKAGFRKIRLDCEDLGLEFPDIESIIANITDEKINEMRVVEFGEIPSTENVTQPVVLSRSYFGHVDNTLRTWEFEMHSHHGSGFALYAFWGIVLIIAALNHVFRTIDIPDTTKRLSSEGFCGSVLSSRRWVQTNLLIPPVFGSYHQRLLFWCTIPTRMEGIVVGTFYLFATYLCLIDYRVIGDNIYWDDHSHQFWRYVADRTGIMSYATLPLIWIFAGRNNIFMWATGMSYQAFNIYHRHIARVGTILAIVHSIVYTWLYIKFEGFELYRKELVEVWFFLGIAATVAMSFLLLSSHAWLRVKFYETFLMLHIALSVVVLIGCFVHTSIFNAAYDAYLWPLVFIWLFDRGLRLLRLILCNIRVKFSRTVIHRTRSTASYNKDSDVVRIDIAVESMMAQPAAGQFYYIYQPTTWQGYENHPFTLGAWSSQPTFSDSSDSPLLTRLPTNDDYGDENLDSSQDQFMSSQTNSTLTFWVRPYDGWTKRLRDECLQAPNHAIRPTMLLEGPYGHHTDLYKSEEVLLIAGGTGIASAVPYILEHINLAKTRNMRTNNVHLIWTARQAAFIQEVFDKELRAASQRTDFHASLFYTRFDNLPTQGRKSSGSDTRSPSTRIQIPDVQNGRPDIRTTIKKAAYKAQVAGIRLAVLVCGPAGMADEARLAVHAALREGCHCVDYYEESFGS